MRFSLLLFLIPVLGFSQTNDSLKIYYNFSNNANDQSGNANHADIRNCIFTKDADNNDNSALYLSGYKDSRLDSGFVEFPEVLDGAKAFTVSLIVKYMSFEKNNAYEEAFVSFGTLQSGGTGSTGIYYREGSKRLIFAVQTNKGNTYYGFNWNSKWNNTWQHFALSYSETTGEMSCYHNGKLLGTKGNISGAIEAFSVDKAQLGKHYWQNGSGQSKRMEFAADEVYVFTRALDSAEVRSVYNNTYLSEGDTCDVTVYDTVAVYDTIRIVQYDTVQVIEYDTVITQITEYDTVKISVEDTLIAYFNYTSVNNTNEKSHAQIFPKPSTSTIYLIIDDNADMSNVSFEITDINGKLIKRETVLSASTTIDMSKEGEGIYFMRLYQNSKVLFNKKLMLK